MRRQEADESLGGFGSELDRADRTGLSVGIYQLDGAVVEELHGRASGIPTTKFFFVNLIRFHDTDLQH